MENQTNLMKKFQIAIAIFAGAIILFIGLIVQTVPEFNKLSTIKEEIIAKTDAVAAAESKLADLQNSMKKQEENNDITEKAIFKPITAGLDSESAISDEFGEILQLMRENKIKARSVKYDYDPQDDNFVKGAPDRFHVCKITSEMIATYEQFENFIRELYKHEHFLDISSVEIVPYQKNKRILLINLEVKLYSQKG